MKKENNDDQEEQVALYAKKGGRPKCNHCSKIGHMSKDCWELEKNKNKKAEYLKKHGTNNKDVRTIIKRRSNALTAEKQDT